MPVPPCTQCGKPAVSQWTRPATDAEAAAHWDQLEAAIRESVPAYRQNRDDTVLMPEYGCADHPEGGANATAQ